MPSASEYPLSRGISGRHCAEGLLDLCRVRFDLDIRQRLRRRAAPINIPPSSILLCSYVRITVLERLRQIIRRLALAFSIGLNSRIAQAVSKNRHDGHAKLGTSRLDFRSNLGLRWVRRASAFDRRSAPTLLP